MLYNIFLVDIYLAIILDSYTFAVSRETIKQLVEREYSSFGYQFLGLDCLGFRFNYSLLL